MSRVMLITADKPLPLCSRQAERRKTVRINGTDYTVSAEMGFAVGEHSYYRGAVDELCLSMKPYQYELQLEEHEDDLAHLRSYLQEHFSPGEEAELWNLWVGIDRLGQVPRYRGQLSGFDMETLKQFVKPPHEDGGIGQCCMTILI